MFALNSIKRILTGTRSSKWILASAAAVALATPALSQAAPAGHSDGFDHRNVERREVVQPREIEHREVEHRDFDHRGPDRNDFDRRDLDRHDYDRHDGIGFGLNIRIGDPRPVIERRTVRVWVPAVYNTVTEQVWIPDQFQDRPVSYLDNGRWCTRTDHVLVLPGHYETQQRQVCVTEGHYELRPC